MKKKLIISIGILTIILVIIGVILLIKNNSYEKNKIEILDATYTCAQVIEKFYEDDEYEYFFSCAQSNSTFVKLSDGNKMLVVTALEEGKVTIKELEEAGLYFIKEKK